MRGWPTTFGLSLILIVLGGASAIASSPRTETADYLIGTSTCGLPTPMASRHCFPLHGGETEFHVVILEESPTRKLGLPIVAVVRFIGVPSFNYAVCGSETIPMEEPGATGISVEVQQGERGGFCGPNSDDISPALKGTITVTFTN